MYAPTMRRPADGRSTDRVRVCLDWAFSRFRAWTSIFFLRWVQSRSPAYASHILFISSAERAKEATLATAKRIHGTNLGSCLQHRRGETNVAERVCKRHEATPNDGRDAQSLDDHANDHRNRWVKLPAAVPRASANRLDSLRAAPVGSGSLGGGAGRPYRRGGRPSADDDQTVRDSQNDLGHGLLGKTRETV